MLGACSSGRAPTRRGCESPRSPARRRPQEGGGERHGGWIGPSLDALSRTSGRGAAATEVQPRDPAFRDGTTPGGGPSRAAAAAPASPRARSTPARERASGAGPCCARSARAARSPRRTAPARDRDAPRAYRGPVAVLLVPASSPSRTSSPGPAPRLRPRPLARSRSATRARRVHLRRLAEERRPCARGPGRVEPRELALVVRSVHRPERPLEGAPPARVRRLGARFREHRREEDPEPEPEERDPEEGRPPRAPGPGVPSGRRRRRRRRETQHGRRVSATGRRGIPGARARARILAPRGSPLPEERGALGWPARWRRAVRPPALRGAPRDASQRDAHIRADIVAGRGARTSRRPRPCRGPTSARLRGGRGLGEIHAASLVRSVRELAAAQGARPVGTAIGGERLRALGVEPLADPVARARTGFDGVLQSLPYYAGVWSAPRGTPRTRSPTLRPRRLARAPRAHGPHGQGPRRPVVHLVAPQYWGWAPWRVGPTAARSISR